jgi:acyl-CoA thioester hydrolase
MPLTTERQFRIRYHECDANGHLFNANYVRFMQEAAFDASSAAGYDLSKYAEIQGLWLVRRTTVEFLQPVFYNNTIAVKTWVADFQKASSRRMYEFSLPEKKNLIARAHTDWVYVNSETNRPTPIPKEMQLAFFPEGVPEKFPEREKFPKLPKKPPVVFSTRRHVEWKDIDSAGLVNNPCFLEYTAECGFQAIAAFNWPWEKMVSEGFAILLRKIIVQHLQPAVYGDELEITTWVSDVRRVSATRHYEITRVRDGVVLGQMHTLGVWVNLMNGSPTRIPDRMLLDFKDNITGVND